MRLSRRIAKNKEKPIQTDIFGATKKLIELVDRARNNSLNQGLLVPIQALVTIENDEWTWQTVNREVLMTSSMDNAMDAASMIVELDGGCVLIESLEA
jgi:hypothetical protein